MKERERVKGRNALGTGGHWVFAPRKARQPCKRGLDYAPWGNAVYALEVRVFLPFSTE
jgi:hypothetical protein